jgi:hypothetical protein
MKMAIALLFGFLVSQCAHAEESNLRRPHWVIIATIIDRTTGEQLGQTKLTDPELVFHDPVQCKSIIRKVHPITSANVTAVLTCLKVGPASYL